MKAKHVLITGASRGIGRAIALSFARDGWNVAVSCRHDSPELESLQREVKNTGVSFLPFIGDMGLEEDVREMFRRIRETFGSLDVLVNNAGISHSGLLQDMSLSQWDAVLRTNLTSAFLCCREVIPMMLANQSGSIINISSVWGNTGAATETAYCASKGGMNGFTKALAKELAPSNIAVNAIACGVIDTDMNDFLSPEEKLSLIEEIPAGRMGSPVDVAETALALAGSTRYLTGQIITLDGGWT